MTELTAVILAGGLGLRLQERTKTTPKALLEIGSRPILDHILYHLSLHHVTRVIIAGGYRFRDLEQHGFGENRYGLEVQLVDTGEHTNTGGRLAEIAFWLDHQPFLMCWCDAVSAIDFSAMVEQHKRSDALVTLGAVNPPARFGDLVLEGQRVVHYAEKAAQVDRWISGGYFVVDPNVLALIQDSQDSWEYDVLPQVADAKKLNAYRHRGAWQCMDTLYEHQLLNSIYASGSAFWPLPQDTSVSP